MVRFILFLLAAAAVFGAYAAMQVTEALRAGTSLRDGLESAIAALVFLALGLWLGSRRRTRTARYRPPSE